MTPTLETARDQAERLVRPYLLSDHRLVEELTEGIAQALAAARDAEWSLATYAAAKICDDERVRQRVREWHETADICARLVEDINALKRPGESENG